MLLESLIAILIFSVGILAIVGMQGAAVKATSDAKYRSDAGILANNLIAQMWASDHTAAKLLTNFQAPGDGTGGPLYMAWLNDPNGGVYATLPGSPANPPQVSMAQTVLYTDLAGLPVKTSQVTILIQWKAPNDPDAAPTHSYTVTTQIE